MQEPQSSPAAEDLVLDAGAKPVWSLDQVLAQFDRFHSAWGPSQIDFSFFTEYPDYIVDHDTPEAQGFAPFSPEERAWARLAFERIAAVCDLRFTERPYNEAEPSPTNQRIALGGSTGIDEDFWGYAVTERRADADQDGRLEIIGGDVWVNWDAADSQDWFEGGYNFSLLIHEVLHTLGLPHPGNYNVGGPPISYGDSAVYFQDSRQYTQMSYWAAANTGADHTDADDVTWYGATPLLHDIAALQFIYGANTSARLGDTVYGHGSTAGSAAFDFTLNRSPVVSLWDAGGIDTLNLAGSPTACRVDLNAGAFSDVYGLTGNLSIAYGAAIENARGSVFADALTGNALANWLYGAGGADQVGGGVGNDTLIGAGGGDGLRGEAGSDTLNGGAGNDLLVGGAGQDVMLGGAGADRFAFLALSDSKGVRADLIRDLGADDRLDLAAIDADTTVAGNQAFHHAAAFTRHAGELVLTYVASEDRTLLRLDVNGDARADFALSLLGRIEADPDWVL